MLPGTEDSYIYYSFLTIKTEESDEENFYNRFPFSLYPAAFGGTERCDFQRW